MKFAGKYILFAIIIAEIIFSINVKWGKERWKENISFDGKGYYAYLPAIFIYKDLNFGFRDEIEQKYSNEKNWYEYRVKAANGIIDKYFFGTSLLQLPFFLVANFITRISGGVADGYSFYYMIAICLASVFWQLTGLFFLRKFLRNAGVSENAILIAILSITFGTHLFYYTVFDPSFSHSYSFGLICLFIYLIQKYINQNRSGLLLLIAIVLGLIYLVRPVNILVVLSIPFIASDSSNFKIFVKKIFDKKLILLLSLLIFLITSFIQHAIYYLQCGLLFPDPYPVEHFNWMNPHMFDILFSYKKGLFVYTPIVLLSMLGFFIAQKKSTYQITTFFIFFLAITYVFSSWWSWWYGGSFSSRPYVEYLGFFAILLAFFYNQLKKKWSKVVLLSTILCLVIICQVQTYQYRYYIIHWDKMDKEHYWRVFMRIDQIIDEKNANSDLIENK